MLKKPPALEDPVQVGLNEIDQWGTWFREAHTRRLHAVTEFGDPHLIAQELAKIDALTVAIVGKMRADFLLRQP